MSILYKNLERKAFNVLRSYKRAQKIISGRFSVYTATQEEEKKTPCHWSAEPFKDRIAIGDSRGDHTYASLFSRSCSLAKVIREIVRCPKESGEQSRITMLCPNDSSYVVAQWAVWLTGHIAVPLHPKHPPALLEYFINDSQSDLLLVASNLKPLTDKLERKSFPRSIHVIDENRQEVPPLQDVNFSDDDNATILYTSGTTGSPKGVVWTHGIIKANILNMIKAWHWTKNDRILHCLPLHHTHGLMNALLCPLHIGAHCVMLPKFDASEVWDRLLSTEVDKRITVLMGVPTMYAKLIEEYDKQFKNSPKTKDFIKAFCKQQIRLMVSGSSSLPTPVFERWEEITGHRLLERYGMTEIGMALTNPYDGARRPGFVGNPFPSVQVRIAEKNFYTSVGYDVIVDGSSDGNQVTPGKEKQEGELLVKGPTVFKEYWKRESATSEAFTKDGWFKTGDTAVYVDEMYKIQGRTSVDIIKSGGYKISALDIEHHLLSYLDIADCAVIGVNDLVWGQKVAAVVVTKSGEDLPLSSIQEWCKMKLAPYQIPTVSKTVKQIPRNALGKVNKVELAKEMFPS